ncbi:E3 ubiquitin-protein ligase rififylin [Gadus chalcogrammus]|uniref:E3 ubiquitin-protein ligase rififylin n=1 Tax=Gadus chalcogrammus TaxID=1042646 RepID=UPI0024C4C25E|nr:E3 ubiquitin-protein ligase rififylin [Gadus chalcogrammus]
MWSCCSWLCVDDVPSEEPARRGHCQQAYTNSGYSSQPSANQQPRCKACGDGFHTLARKHVCVDCKKDYCSSCSAEADPRPRLCHTCQRFYGNLLEPAELMKLKVKDLRDYLHLHEVPTQLCREKEELVELVLGQQTPSPGSTSPLTSSFELPPFPPDQHTTPTHTAPSDSAHTTHTDVTTHAHAHTEPAHAAAPPSAHTASTETFPTETLPVHTDPAAAPTPTDTAPGGTAPPQGTDEVEVEVSDSESLTGPQLEWSDSEEVAVPGRRASLSDLSSLEDIEQLSVRQLKEILARNFVNYKGCCEKWELMERVTRLYQNDLELHNQGLGDSTAAGEDLLCRVCMDSPIDCVLLECGHMVTCTKCGKRMSECPICRQYVVRAVHVFRS